MKFEIKHETDRIGEYKEIIAIIDKYSKIFEKEKSKCKKCGLPKSEHDEGDVIKFQCPDIDEASEFEEEGE